MLLFATEFPAKSSSSADEILKCAINWLDTSPHHAWQIGDLSIPEKWTKTSHSKSGEIVEMISIDDEYYWVGLRHIWTENRERTWTTEIISRETAGELVVSVRIFCDAHIPGARLPFPKKPYILQQLIKKIGGGADGEFTTSDKPVYLRSSDLDLAADVIQGNCSGRLPIVYVSAGYDGVTERIDTKRLARWLSCIAHVVVEPDAEFNRRLSEYTGANIPYDTAAAVYWPKGAASRHLFAPSSFADTKQMATAISNSIRRNLTFVKASEDFVWAFLTEKLASRKIEEAKKSSDAGLDEFIEEYEEKISSQKSQINDLRNDNERLRGEVRRMSSIGSPSSDGFLHFGEEHELYSGEFSDIVVEVLSSLLPQLMSGSRKQHVVEDLVGANPISTYRKGIHAKIKSILHSARDLNAQNKQDLQKLGFNFDEDRKHIKLTYAGDSRYMFTSSKTSGDHRGMKNLVGDILRILFK